MDPEAAMPINVPTVLVKWLSSFGESGLLIHLSTDQALGRNKIIASGRLAFESEWMDSVLAKGEPFDFFHDEFHCPVFVKDLAAAIQILTN